MMEMDEGGDDAAKLAVLEEIRALMDQLDADQLAKSIPKLAAKEDESEEEGEEAKEEVSEGENEDPDVAMLKKAAEESE